MKGWVLNRIIKYKKKIGEAALDYFVDTVGNDCRLLEQEIKKAAVYKGAEQVITLEDIRALTSTGQLDSFELINLLRKKEKKKALVLLNKLKKEEDPIALLGLIVSQYRLFLQIRQAIESGFNLNDLARKVGKHKFYLQKISEDLRRYNFSSLKNHYYQLQKIDLAVKTGRKDSWVAVEEFVLGV